MHIYVYVYKESRIPYLRTIDFDANISRKFDDRSSRDRCRSTIYTEIYNYIYIYV